MARDMEDMTKDWLGNKKTVFTTLGASSHANEDRQRDDFYATDPKALRLLLSLETFENVWEPACGAGHLSEILKEADIHGRSTDYHDRGYGDEVFDFLGMDNTAWVGDIITNPPFSKAQEFAERALELVPEGRKVALFLRIQFLEGAARKIFFEKFPPKVIYVSSKRLNCAKNGDFKRSSESSAVCYCWFVWVKGYKGETVLRWFN